MTARKPRRTAVEELIDAAWARALYEAWCRYETSPIFDQLAAEHGNPISVETRAG